VFKKGTRKGFKGKREIGGHTNPNSTQGDKLEWKKAQKNPAKNITSLEINNNILIFKPFWTRKVWYPCIKDSRKTSRHQNIDKKQTKKKENKEGKKILLLNQTTNLLRREREQILTKIGQGETSTIWNICLIFFIKIF
jgi:hypothetical protein